MGRSGLVRGEGERGDKEGGGGWGPGGYIGRRERELKLAGGRRKREKEVSREMYNGRMGRRKIGSIRKGSVYCFVLRPCALY